jgi:hypothetical protein
MAGFNKGGVIRVAKRVVLDSMIRRADFAEQQEASSIDLFDRLSIDRIESGSPIVQTLRKPDFQRETNHWSPDQVATFIASFADGELIPALILWNSSSYLFVIDGGHRLSALRAWVEDDYGENTISYKFFDGEVPEEQRKIANRTRKLVESKVGKYADFKRIMQNEDSADQVKYRRANNIFRRALQVQWIQGSQQVAEVSFFKINSQGTPLDPIEELLLKNRNKSYAISARSIVRAATGHKYWSAFDSEVKDNIEIVAKSLYKLLFQPDIKEPIKTLDLPLGGASSPVDALKMLLDTFAIVDGATDPEKKLGTISNDEDGSETLQTLQRTKRVVSRITGTGSGSLGLHPAVYFYNENGKHSRFLFLGTLKVFADAVRNNSDFFTKFTIARGELESYLISKKSIINQGLANVNSRQRIARVKKPD